MDLKKIVLGIVLITGLAAAASVSDIQFTFTDSGGNLMNPYPAGYNGLVVTRAEVSDDNAFYNDWMTNLVTMDLKCYFYPVNGMTLETQHMWVGCQSAGGGTKSCRRYVAFDVLAENVEGGRVECFVNGQKTFASKIPFAQASQPPAQTTPNQTMSLDNDTVGIQQPQQNQTPATPQTGQQPYTQPGNTPAVQPQTNGTQAGTANQTQPIAPPPQTQPPAGQAAPSPCATGLIAVASVLGLALLKRE